MSSSSNTTKTRITQTSKTLRKATKITARRKAAEDLIRLLTDSNLRNKFKRECMFEAPKKTSISEKYHTSAASTTSASSTRVLRKIYRGVINDVISSTKQTLNSKVKLKAEDIILPLKILRAIDSESDAALSSLKQDQNCCGYYNGYNRTYDGWFYVPEPFTFQSFHRYRDTNATLTHLSSKEIRSLLDYCINCLNSEDVCLVAEKVILELLLKLCSRSDYVALFGTYSDYILNIIEQVHTRIMPSNSHHTSMLSLNGAKIFYYLFHNLIAELGIEVNIFVRPCLALVVDWARNENSNSQLLQFMYGAAVDIMATYPEQCVGIFTGIIGSSSTDNGSNYRIGEDHDADMGKDLFGHAQRRWNTARGIDRDVLVGYFSAHL